MATSPRGGAKFDGRRTMPENVGMPERPQSPAMEFLLDALKKDRKASYADLRARAEEKRLKVYPIMFGRAQALLGYVKSAKRGTGRTARASAAMRAKGAGRRGRPADASSKSGRIRELLGSGMSVSEIAKKVSATPALVYNVRARSEGGTTTREVGKRRPGRSRKGAEAGSSFAGISGILEAVKSSEREREQMRAALEKIQALIADALG